MPAGPTRDDGHGPLWTAGDMLLRVIAGPGRPDQMIKIGRPYAVIGRDEQADVRLEAVGASRRHVYLHLDPRGVYAVDLLSRSGMWLKGRQRMACWLRPGDRLEVGGCQIEVARLRIGGSSIHPDDTSTDLLTDTNDPTLPEVHLEPARSGEAPWSLGSELVVLGASKACGIPIPDPAVAPVHAAIARSREGVYLVPLQGRGTWVEDREARVACSLRDGELLTFGSTRFTVRVKTRGRPVLTADIVQEPAPLPARVGPASIPAETQEALIAWVVGAVRGGQGEALRRQGEFQVAITDVLRQIQKDNATLLNAHMSRIENIDRELAALRAEIERRGAGEPAPSLPALVKPNVAPLNIARPAPRDPDPASSRASTTWLLQRVGQLETENRAAWKDLLGKLGS